MLLVCVTYWIVFTKIVIIQCCKDMQEEVYNLHLLEDVMLFSCSYYTSYDSAVLSSSRSWSPVIVSLALPTDITKLLHASPSVTLPTDIRALAPDKFLSVEITISYFD